MLNLKEYLSRGQISRWFVDRSTEKSEFPTIILFTDEACFIRDGIFNNHNSHTWAEGKICGQRLWGAMYATF